MSAGWGEGDAPAGVGGGEPCQRYPVVVLAAGGRVADEDVVRAALGGSGGAGGDHKAAASGRHAPANRPGGLRDLVEEHLLKYERAA